MKVTYTQEGADPRVWSFKPGKLLNIEAEEIERRTGMDFNEWAAKLPPAALNMRVLHGLLFVLLKRTIPTLKWDEVQFTADELDFQLELDEKQEAVKNLKAMLSDGRVPTDDADDVREAVAELEKEIADEAGPAAGDDEAPKVPVALTSGDGGNGTSHTTSTSTQLTSIG